MSRGSLKSARPFDQTLDPKMIHFMFPTMILYQFPQTLQQQEQDLQIFLTFFRGYEISCSYDVFHFGPEIDFSNRTQSCFALVVGIKG